MSLAPKSGWKVTHVIKPMRCAWGGEPIAFSVYDEVQNQICRGSSTPESAVKLHPKNLPPNCRFCFFFLQTPIYVLPKPSDLFVKSTKEKTCFAPQKSLARHSQKAFQTTRCGSVSQPLGVCVTPRFEQQCSIS